MRSGGLKLIFSSATSLLISANENLSGSKLCWNSASANMGFWSKIVFKFGEFTFSKVFSLDSTFKTGAEF